MYIGFLINGCCAMVFTNRTEAYYGYKRGLGFVGEIDNKGNIKPLWVHCRYMSLYPSNIKENELANRLEIIDPNNWLIKYIKRGIEYDMRSK